MRMVDEVPAIDLEAFTVFDHQRLLAALDRAIGEEAVHRLNETSSSDPRRNRARLQALCRLVSVIPETADAGSCGRTAGKGRRTTRAL